MLEPGWLDRQFQRNVDDKDAARIAATLIEDYLGIKAKPYYKLRKGEVEALKRLAEKLYKESYGI